MSSRRTAITNREKINNNNAGSSSSYSSSSSSSPSSMVSFFSTSLNILLTPIKLLFIIAKVILNLVLLFFIVLWELLSNLKWVILIISLWLLGFWMFQYYGPIVSQMEHFNRCYVYEYWNEPLRDFTDMLTYVWNKIIPWTNLLGQLNRLLSLKLLTNTLRDCHSAYRPFDTWDCIKLIVDIMAQFLSDTFGWIFSTNLFYSAYPMYNLLENISTRLIPYMVNALICLCEDTQVIFIWMERIMTRSELVCIGHQLINVPINVFQTVVQFIRDLLSLILTIFLTGGSLNDIRDTLIGVIPGDLVIPTLSKVTSHERTNAAAFYLSTFLNRVFSISYCTVTSEIDAFGDVTLTQSLYNTCRSNSNNNPQLFCAVGVIFTAIDRLYRLQTTLLWYIPQVLYEVFTQPPGDRWLSEVWFDERLDYFFDTIRDPPLRYDYSVSINFPTPIDGSDGSTILWPNEYLYGPSDISKPNCHLSNNSRFDIPCSQCPVVADIDGESCLCLTAVDLDEFTEPLIGYKIWVPWLCCGVSRLARVGVALIRFAVGTIINILHFDRLGTWLCDQNHYDIFWTELLGPPYQLGGLLVCIRNIIIGFDSRLRPFSDLFLKPVKAAGEAIRLLNIAIVRLLNDIVGTGEPGFPDYICVTNFYTCVDMERVFSHLRRPRIFELYDATFLYTNIDTVNFEPAFINCVCYFLSFQVLVDFLPNPPDALPDFCCPINFIFRNFFIEQFKYVLQLWITLIESVITIFDPDRPFTLVIVEWLACVSITSCSNLGDILSDTEDLLNCPCQIIIQVDDIISPRPKTEFFCICDFLSSAVQWFINAQRQSALLASAIWDLIYCIGNSWPEPHCAGDLWKRFKKMFAYTDTVHNAMAGAIGSIGCVLGLPWVGAHIDCLGTAYTWPLDYPPCHTSMTTDFGPDKAPCTMSDRMSTVLIYIVKFITAASTFTWKRLEVIVDIAFKVATGFDSDGESTGVIETKICTAIVSFFREIRNPLFGQSVRSLNDDFGTMIEMPWPNNDTGINWTKVYKQLAVNISNDSWANYELPTSTFVYGRTFNWTILEGVEEKTGVIQALGLALSCLLGPPTPDCKGDPYADYAFIGTSYRGKSGCLGDLLVILGNVLRDVYGIILDFIEAGCLIIENLFTDPESLGDSIVTFIRTFFKLLIVIVDSAELIFEGVMLVIIEVIRFIFGPLGDGIAIMLKFFLTFVSKVIGVFISLIKFLLAPLTKKRDWGNMDFFEFIFHMSPRSHDDDDDDDDDDDIHFPTTLSEAYLMGFDNYMSDKNIEKYFYFDVASQQQQHQNYQMNSTDDDDNNEDGQGYTSSRSNQRERNYLDYILDSSYWRKIMNPSMNYRRSVENTEDINEDVFWSRLHMDAFGNTQINLMTDDTLCKKIMVTLNGLNRFNDFDLAQEVLWTGCFILFSLPNEIYGYTNGQLALEPDFFYNPLTFFTRISSLLKTFMGYTSYRSEKVMGNNFGTSYTEVIQVPQEILDYAEEQALIQEQLAASALNTVDSSATTSSTITIDNTGDVFIVNNDGLSSLVGDLSVDLSSTTAKRSYGRILLTSKEVSKSKFRNYGVSYGNLVDGSENIENNPNVCKILPFQTVKHCINTNILYKGYTIIIKNHDGNYKRKRGFIDLASGSSLKENINFSNQIDASDPNSPHYNPFLGASVTLYTSLSGHLVLNISKLGYLVPVIDGKIAITHTNMSFWDYMRKERLDTDLNINYVTSYEDYELTETKESYLKLNAKSINLNNVVTNNYTTVILDSDPNTTEILATGSNYVNLNEELLGPPSPSPSATSSRKRATSRYDKHKLRRANQNQRTSSSSSSSPPPRREADDPFSPVYWINSMTKAMKKYTVTLDASLKSTVTEDNVKDITRQTLKSFSDSIFDTYYSIDSHINNPYVISDIVVSSADSQFFHQIPLREWHSNEYKKKRGVEVGGGGGGDITFTTSNQAEFTQSFKMSKRQLYMEDLSKQHKEYTAILNEKNKGPLRSNYLYHWTNVVVPHTISHMMKTVNSYFTFGKSKKFWDRANEYTKELNQRLLQTKKRSSDYDGLPLQYQQEHFPHENSIVYLYNNTLNELIEYTASSVFTIANNNSVVGPSGYTYSSIDEVYVLFIGQRESGYKTVQEFILQPSKIHGSVAPTHIDPRYKDYTNDNPTFYLHPSDSIFHHYPSYNGLFEDLEWLKEYNYTKPVSKEKLLQLSEANMNRLISFKALLNYYEDKYMTYNSNRPCMNNVMWIEYWKFDLTLPDSRINTTTTSTTSFSFIPQFLLPVKLSREEYQQYLIDELEQQQQQQQHNYNESTPNTVVVPIFKCYRQNGQSIDHPHQEKYGHILKGRDPLSFHFEQLGTIKDMIISNITYNLSWDNVKRKFKQVYMDPWITKYRDTIHVHKKEPTITKSLVLYEDIRQNIYGNDDDSWKIPDYFWIELGHGVTYPHSDTDVVDKKRSHFPPIVDLCLPKNESDPSNIQTKCRKCEGCAKEHCHYCSLCWNCTLDPLTGSTSCNECGSCRISKYPHCSGECYNCTDCMTESVCLNCKFVQQFVAAGFEMVDYTIKTSIYNDTSVKLNRTPGVSKYNVIHYDSSIHTQPVFSNYGYGNLFGYLSDLLNYWLTRWTGVDVVQTVYHYIITTNENPYAAPVGLWHSVKYDWSIPFVSTCNRDLHLSCDFGYGLETALIIVAVIFLIIIIGIWFNFGLFGLLFGFASIPSLVSMSVAHLAWNYNPLCSVEPTINALKAMNLNFLIFPMLPTCAMDEVYALLNKIFTRCWDNWIPSEWILSGVVCPESCDVYIEPVNCADYGFTNLFTITGYIGQRFIPEPLNYWLNTYLNNTCLVQGGCLFGIQGEAQSGVLGPFFDVNFQVNQTNATMTTLTDACLVATSFGYLMIFGWLLITILAAYVTLKVFMIFFDAFLDILNLEPLPWIFPWGRINWRVNR